jgi:dynein heavy chain, axonemal
VSYEGIHLVTMPSARGLFECLQKNSIHVESTWIGAQQMRKVSLMACRYIDNPEFVPEIVAKQSAAAKSLCLWVRAMDKFHIVNKVVEPKKAKLQQAEDELAEANGKLKEKRQSLQAVMDRVAELERQLALAEKEQEHLNAQADLTKARLERAGKLTSALGDEGVRWQQTADDIEAAMTLLVGDVLVSAASISYSGAFTGPYRQHLLRAWVARCFKLGIPISEGVSLKSTLASAVEIREWSMLGLPSDEVSIDNGILVKHGKRWPLMIDPQAQANTWIRAMESKNGLRIIKLTDGNFLRTLENCIRVGNPVLLEDAGEVLDPSLEPLLQRAIFHSGGRVLIRLGDSDVDYDPAFKFYITTKIANPHYLPEVCIKVTIINFTVTMKGLEDQLLGDVVRKERPDLEDQRDRLVVSISNDKRQLKDLEDKILRMLKNSKGNILDDAELINTLNNSKVTSGLIQGRVKEAEVTEHSINVAREEYRDAATRGSILYFVVADLALISPMYQYSLAFFARLFNFCIDHSQRSEDVGERLQLLCNFATTFIYNNVQRGLFQEHKILFSFLLTTSILRHEQAGSVISPSVRHFLPHETMQRSS